MPSDLAPLQYVVPALEEDVRNLLQELEVKPSAVAARSLVRAVFAFIDATLHAMKDVALGAHEQRHVRFSAADLAMLKEESYFVDDRGMAKSRPAYTHTPANIKFAIAKLGESAFSPYRVKGSDAEWGALTDAIRIRNRLVHPKRPEDLIISPSEQATVMNTYHWFQKNFRYALADALRGLRNELSRREGSQNLLPFSHERKSERGEGAA